MPAAFVSFKTRWGAAVCAQTQQTSNPTVWLTEWAPEPRDVFWANLAIPYVELSVRRLIIAVSFFFLTFFFMVPIAIVQSLANLDDIEKVLPFLKPIIERWVSLFVSLQLNFMKKHPGMPFFLNREACYFTNGVTLLPPCNSKKYSYWVPVIHYHLPVQCRRLKSEFVSAELCIHFIINGQHLKFISRHHFCRALVEPLM